MHWKLLVTAELEGLRPHGFFFFNPRVGYSLGAREVCMKLVAILASIAILVALAPVKTQSAPASSAESGSAPAYSSAAAAPSIKPISKRFLLSHSTAVYKQPDKTSAVVAHVKARTHVNVIGITGNWLQIKLARGGAGFIPETAAE